MTRKHKPHTPHKKRPTAPVSKPVKAATAEKAGGNAGLRDKERSRSIAGAKKTAPAVRAAAPHGKHESVRAVDAKALPARHGADKRPLGIERRVPVMPEDRQSQLK